MSSNFDQIRLQTAKFAVHEYLKNPHRPMFMCIWFGLRVRGHGFAHFLVIYLDHRK